MNQTSGPPSPPPSTSHDRPASQSAVTPAAKCFSDDLKSGRLLWPEPWASQASVQADNVARAARLALDGEPSPYQQRIIDAIDHLLGHVKESSARKRFWQRPLDRWRGTSVERAHGNLHAAKVLLVDLLPEHEIDTLIPSAVARASSSLKRRDIRRSDIEALQTDPPSDLVEKRAQVKRAVEIGYDALDQHHTRIRGFRNLLVIVSAVIFIFMAALVALVWRAPDSVPLCFEPSITSGQPAVLVPGTPTAAPTAAPSAAPPSTLTRRVCPSGQDPPNGVSMPRGPSSRDVAIVAGLGVLGGAVAAAFAIRNVRGTSTPYDVPLALALLKVPTGALTAVVGIVLLGGGFVPGLSELDSQRQILAYSLVFGYAQQLATRFIDNQAQTILSGLPSKDSKAKQARQPSAQQTTQRRTATPGNEQTSSTQST